MTSLARAAFPIAACALLCVPAQAAWYPLGPFGGSASIVVADPHSSKTFVAGTRNGLLFRSTDAGEFWTPLDFPAQLQATLNALVIDPQIGGVYLAGLSSDLPDWSGILRSTDNGATWQQVPDLRGRQVHAIAYKRLESKIVAAGTDTGVFLSRDGGVTWRRASPRENAQLQPVVSLAFDPKSSDRLYAGTPHLPWMTADGGVLWRSIATGMIDDSDIFAIQVDRNRPQRVFASACSGIYRSLNGGAAWVKLNGARDASYRTYAIVQDPQYENVWFAGTTDGIVVSRDGGNTWVKLGPDATRSIAFDPGRLGRMFIATDESGILRSEDSGVTWTRADRGFCNRILSSLWVSPDGVFTAAGIPGKTITYRLKADLSGWKQVDRSIGSPRPFEAGRLRTGVGLPAGTAVNEIVTIQGRSQLMATSSGLKASDDSGRSWHTVRGELQSDSIQAIYRHPAQPGTVFAAKFGNVYRSTDAGRTWARVSPQNWPIRSVRQFAIAPESPRRLLILTRQQGIWALELESGRD